MEPIRAELEEGLGLEPTLQSERAAEAATPPSERLAACDLHRNDSSAALGGGGGGGASVALFGVDEDDDDHEEEEVDGPLPSAGGDPMAAKEQQKQQELQDQQKDQQEQHQLAATLRHATAAAAAASAAAAGSVPGGGGGIEAAYADLRRHPRHVLVFSTAGKPIYSYRGDEGQLAGLCATAEALLSVAHSRGHALRHVRCALPGGRAWRVAAVPPLISVGPFPSCLHLGKGIVGPSIYRLLVSNCPPPAFSHSSAAGRAAACLRSWSARRCAWWACRRWESRRLCCACRWVVIVVVG